MWCIQKEIGPYYVKDYEFKPNVNMESFIDLTFTDVKDFIVKKFNTKREATSALKEIKRCYHWSNLELNVVKL